MIKKLYLISVLCLSTNLVADENQEPTVKDFFIQCTEIATKQYDRSMDRCFKRWSPHSKDRCFERAERVYNDGMDRCEKVLDKCENWFR